ncbi:MAG: type IV pilus modification PilV family protein [Candidatus Saccharibacteria bacterium]
MPTFFPAMATDFGLLTTINMVNNQSKLFDQSGMTLIEVLASLVIITIVFMSVLSVFMSGMAWISGSSRRTEAVNYAASVIEELKAHPDMVKAGAGEVRSLCTGLTPPDGIGAAWICREYRPELGLYSIEVDVYWSSGSHQQNEQLVTLVYGSS